MTGADGPRDQPFIEAARSLLNACMGRVEQRRCAYCGRAGQLTREDIFATFLREFYPSYKTYLDHTRAKRFHGAAPVIRDVCRVCNNELLSALDAFMAGLNRAYFSALPTPETRISFRYDHDLLLRWLFKVWYNDARASGLDVGLHREFRDYILGSTIEPPYSVSLLVGILPPFEMRDGQRAGGNPSDHPKLIRFGTTRIADPAVKKDVTLARMLSINSYLFHVLVWRKGAARSTRRRYVLGLEKYWGFGELTRRQRAAELGVANVDSRAYVMATLSSGGALVSRRRPPRIP